MVDGRERAIFFSFVNNYSPTCCNTPDETHWVTKHNTEKKTNKIYMKEESLLLGKRKGISKKEREIRNRVNMTEICHVLHGYRDRLELGSKGMKKGQTHM